MPFLEIATALVEKGFSVIPIEPKGKRPIGGYGVTHRTRDVTLLAKWAVVFPDANVAICADEDTVILESDDITGFALATFNGTGKAYPETLMACGSSEDRPHLFFRRTERATNVGNLVVPGLFECRFNNQYVVGPGSVHPGGSVYRWLNQIEPVAIPDWLVSELARLALSQKNERKNPTVQMANGRVPEGGRHYFLMQEAGRMWDGKINEALFIDRLNKLDEAYCDPPKGDAHVLQCVRDVMKREPFDPGPKVLLGGSPPGESEAEGVEADWRSLSADELVKLDVPPREPVLVEGEANLFYEKSINQILAWRGVGKTNFALGVADALVKGGEILGFRSPKPRRVLYMDGELPISQLQERVRGFVGQEYRHNLQLFSPELITPPRGLNLVSQRDFDNLVKLVEKHKIEVLFLDSQSTLMPGDSTKDEYQEIRLNALRQLRWMGLCIVEMHHVGKQGLQRGLSKNDDILDVQMHLKKSPDWEPEDGLEFEIVYEKVRHAARLESGYLVRLVNGEWVKETTSLVGDVGRLVNEGLSQRDVAKKLKISLRKVNNLAKKARKAGLIDAKIKIGEA